MESKEIQLAWLAGIVDGEGYVRIRMQDNRYKHPVPKYPRRGTSVSLTCSIKIETISMAMLVHVAEILERHGIHYYFGKPVLKPLSRYPATRLEVYRKQDVLRLCELLTPYSIVKRQELQLVASYLIKSTMHKYYRTSVADLGLVDKIKELRHLGNMNQTVLVAGKPKSIVGYGNPELGSQIASECRDSIRGVHNGQRESPSPDENQGYLQS